MSRAAPLLIATALLPGCLRPGEDAPLVVATAWPSPAREVLRESYHRETGEPGPIEWVVLDPGDSLNATLERRGGVDVLLGGPVEAHDRLGAAGRTVAIQPGRAVPWEIARRPDTGAGRRPALEELASLESSPDPRDDPSTLALAKAVLEENGWDEGYEALVRHSAMVRLDLRPGRKPSSRPLEGISRAGRGRDPRRARRFVEFLEGRGLAGPPSVQDVAGARADGLLADLLGAALVDAVEELRQAVAALDRFGHPAEAEAAMGQRPPWPPASVARLRAGPGGEAMVETLLEQVAPDPDGRAWLLESWSRPSRPVDAGLLDQVAGAAGGRLAREPRFRAWLRGEWAAWSRQLYRRVARVAGGYVPS